MPDFPDELDPDATCPACSARGLRAFYHVRGVPAQSNLLVATRAKALAFPTGGVRLAWCDACGFITNTAFDPSLEVEGRYEATQGCSPTFGRFARSLAAEWVGRFSLRGRAVLEVGCGEGEFLRLLCDAGAGRGVGYDPAASPRAAADPAGRVTVVREPFGPGTPVGDAALIVCRHTLEHVPAVADFARAMRRGVPVAVEVPDAARVLADGAFWDVYHEHCSYFTAEALAGLLRRCGLVPSAVRSEYDGQYLVAEATPGEPSDDPDDDAAAAVTAALASRFAARAGETIDRWRTFFDDASARGRRVALWGSGSKAAGFLATLGLGDEVGCVADINPAKAGSYMAGTGQAVVSPSTLKEFRPDVVVAMNPVYRDEIAAELGRLGVACELLTL